MAVEGRTSESDLEIRAGKKGRHRPEVGDTLTLINIQGVVMRDGDGRLWMGITNLLTPSGGVMSHLLPDEVVDVTGEVEDGLEVATRDDPDTPITESRRMPAYRLRGDLLEHIEQQLGG